jgi:hypothetical protein
MAEPEDINKNEAPEITLDSVVETPVEELNDDQKAFIRDNADSLDDDQKETYKEVLEAKEEEDEEDVEVPDPEERSPKKKDEDAPPPKNEEDEGDDLDEDKKINKVVDEKLKPLSEALSEVQRLKDEKEVDSFIRVKPEFEKYRDSMVKYISHPAYKNIPVHNIAAIVASKDLLKMGAKKERDAAQKAKETQGGGAPVRKPVGQKIDWLNAPIEDFEAQKAKVLGRQGS